MAALNQTQSVHANAQQQPSSGNSAATYSPSKIVQVGFYFDWMVTNTDSVNNLTIAGGAGVTVYVPITIPASNTVTIRVLVKNPVSGSESVSMMILSNSISVAGTGLATGTYYSDYLFWNPTVALWQVGSAQVHLGQNAGLSGQGTNAVAIG